jgi:4-hydroxy-tetrahydrodipicolinate synthase
MNDSSSPSSHGGAEETSRVQSVRPLQGLFPPLVVPLGEDGLIDLESLDRQATFLVEGGVDGFWVNGTTGDFFALSDEERLRVLARVVGKVAGKLPVVAQVGDTATRKVIVKGQQALAAGADFLSVAPPYYLDYTQRELMLHYRAIAQAVGRGVILYQVPQMCKVALTVPNIVELAREGVLLGIKDSSGDAASYRRLVGLIRQEKLPFRCFYGAGALMDVSLLLGGDGLMCALANLVPQLCKELYQAAMSGDWPGVISGQRKAARLIEALRLPERTNWAATVATYKWILKELMVIATARVVEPLKPLTPAEEALLRERALPLVEQYDRQFIPQRRLPSETPAAPRTGPLETKRTANSGVTQPTATK